MENLELFLGQLETNYPLRINNTDNCLIIANSGRRGETKEFLLSFSSIISSLNDIKTNIDRYTSEYNESIWRESANLFSDNLTKSLCGVQTRPFFETINKLIAWANKINYTEGIISLTKQNIDKTIDALTNYFTQIKYLCIPLVQNNEDNSLLSILSKRLKECNQQYGTYGIHYFGLKYAKILTEAKINKHKLLQDADLSDTYERELSKCQKVYEIATERGEVINRLCLNQGFIDLERYSSTISNTQPSQIIYYGVPGSGKSHKIDEITKGVPDEQKMRVVFHPEYTNADFVGQIVPRVDDGVDYRFKAGPFSRILKRAYQNIDKPFCLIIEEINRGNASAIFGDLFQLLDRDESGYSKYSVENLDINSYIRSKDNLYNDKEVPSTVKVGDTEWTEITSIRLPPNLSLYATMNTSDQNVFALDNAFQRRWDMELVENNWDVKPNEKNNDKMIAKKNEQKDAVIEVQNQKIKWGDFQQTINSFIGEKSNESNLSSMEDKRLGCWFVKACEYESENKEKKFGISKNVFANKVLKYLWDDAFKFSRQEVFDENIKSLEDLQKQFLTNGFKIFKDECGLKEKIESFGETILNSDTTTQSPSEESSENE